MAPGKDGLPPEKARGTGDRCSAWTRRSILASGVSGLALPRLGLATTAGSDADTVEATGETGYGLAGYGEAGYGAVTNGSGRETATESPGEPPTTTTTPMLSPRVERYHVDEAGSPNPHAEITATWTVTDADRDLETVTVDVLDSASGRTVDSVRRRVGGGDTSGSEVFTIKHSRNRRFEVRLAATDESNNVVTASRTVTE